MHKLSVPLMVLFCVSTGIVAVGYTAIVPNNGHHDESKPVSDKHRILDPGNRVYDRTR